MADSGRQPEERLVERIGPRFARPEVRGRVAGFLRGLLGDVERKNGWQLAEHARETTPDGMQRLLTTARWDPEALRDDVRAYVVVGRSGCTRAKAWSVSSNIRRLLSWWTSRSATLSSRNAISSQVRL